jgi:hypothetical protein
MGGWLLWKNRQLLWFISCAQSIVPLLNGAPMTHLSASASTTIAPSSCTVTHGAKPRVIPEGHSVTESAQPVFNSVWKSNPVPVVNGRNEYEQGTAFLHDVIANTHLVQKDHILSSAQSGNKGTSLAGKRLKRLAKVSVHSLSVYHKRFQKILKLWR